MLIFFLFISSVYENLAPVKIKKILGPQKFSISKDLEIKILKKIL